MKELKNFQIELILIAFTCVCTSDVLAIAEYFQDTYPANNFGLFEFTKHQLVDTQAFAFRISSQEDGRHNQDFCQLINCDKNCSLLNTLLLANV